MHPGYGVRPPSNLKGANNPYTITGTNISLQRSNPQEIISTSLYPSASTVDYATRTARILARRMSIPVYVGCSVDFEGTTVEEETEGLKKVIEAVMEKWNNEKRGTNAG